MSNYQYQDILLSSSPSSLSSMTLTMKHQLQQEPILQQYRQLSNDAFSHLSSNQSTENFSLNNLKSMLDNHKLEMFQWNKTMVSLISHKFHYYLHYNDMAQHSIDESTLFRVIFYISYALIFVIGIIGNALVCYVVFRQATMHSVTNIFIANLAMSDILLCLFAVPFTPLYLLFYKDWVFGSLLCPLVPMVQGVSVYISAFTLMSIAIERYSVIVHPFRRPITLPYCGLMILSIWLLAFILTLPYGIYIKVIPSILVSDPQDQFRKLNSSSESGEVNNPFHPIVNYSELLNNSTPIPQSNPKYAEILSVLLHGNSYCDEMWPSDNLRIIFGISTTVIQFGIPFFIITFCYIKVCTRLWDRIRTRPGNRNCSSQRQWLEKERARRTNAMLISMVCIFAVCWFPLNTYNLLDDFYVLLNWEHSRTMFILFHLVAMSSTCYNPFLYAWLNDNFRKEFKSIFVPFYERTRCWIFKSANQKDSDGKVVVTLHRQSNNPNNTGTNRKNGDTCNLINNNNNYSLALHSKDTKNSTKMTDLKMTDNDNRHPNDASNNNNGKNEYDNNNSDYNDGEFISLTMLDTTTNLVTTNVESINEAELQESLFATSMRNGICNNNSNNISLKMSSDSVAAAAAASVSDNATATTPIVGNQL